MAQSAPDRARAAFDLLAAELSERGVVVTSMFGRLTLKKGKKAIACIDGDHVVFRLPADTTLHDEALSARGAHLFDPAGMGRGMKDWVSVPLSTQDRWREWAEAAIAGSLD